MVIPPIDVSTFYLTADLCTRTTVTWPRWTASSATWSHLTRVHFHSGTQTTASGKPSSGNYEMSKHTPYLWLVLSECYTGLFIPIWCKSWVLKITLPTFYLKLKILLSHFSFFDGKCTSYLLTLQNKIHENRKKNLLEFLILPRISFLKIVIKYVTKNWPL